MSKRDYIDQVLPQEYHAPCGQCGANMPESKRQFCPGQRESEDGDFYEDCENGICDECNRECSKCGRVFCSDCIETVDEKEVCLDCLS